MVRAETFLALPPTDRRKCEEALVQGMALHGQLHARRLTTPQDMHYAEFAENEVASFIMDDAPYLTHKRAAQSQMLLNAIKEYEANKWKVIGQKVGKPAKVGKIS